MFDSIDSILSLAPQEVKPTNLQTIYYIFWEKGFSLKDLDELPLPYIFEILQTFNWVKDQEKKEIEKSKRK
jgi:hypothetical protein